MPFTGESTTLLFAAILMHEPAYPNALSGPARDLLRGLLQKDPAQRLRITDIMKHPFLAEYAAWPIAGLASMRVVTGNTLDSAVMGTMHTLNLTTSDLIGALARGEINLVTAVYKMLRRENHAQELDQWCVTNTTGSSCNGEAQRVGLNERSCLARSYNNHAPPSFPVSFTDMNRSPNRVGGRKARCVIIPRIRRIGPVRPDSRVLR
jgi:serine/threonine protein kinase